MQNRSVLRLINVSFFTKDHIKARQLCKPYQIGRFKCLPVYVGTGIRIEPAAVQTILIMRRQKPVIMCGKAA